MVEHDREVIASADHLLDFGPAAGEHGGRIVARGTPAQVAERQDVGHRPVSVGQEGDSRADQPPRCHRCTADECHGLLASTASPWHGD